jgi:hypothetical protein
MIIPEIKAVPRGNGDYEIYIHGHETYLLHVPTDLSEAEHELFLTKHVERLLSEMRVEEIKLARAHLARVDRTKLAKRVQQDTAPAKPPAMAQTLFALLAPRGMVNNQLGDMEQMYRQNVAELGESTARRLYWFEVLHSVRPALARIFFDVIVDYFRRKLGL